MNAPQQNRVIVISDNEDHSPQQLAFDKSLFKGSESLLRNPYFTQVLGMYQMEKEVPAQGLAGIIRHKRTIPPSISGDFNRDSIMFRNFLCQQLRGVSNVQPLLQLLRLTQAEGGRVGMMIEGRLMAVATKWLEHLKIESIDFNTETQEIWEIYKVYILPFELQKADLLKEYRPFTNLRIPKWLDASAVDSLINSKGRILYVLEDMLVRNYDSQCSFNQFDFDQGFHQRLQRQLIQLKGHQKQKCYMTDSWERLGDRFKTIGQKIGQFFRFGSINDCQRFMRPEWQIQNAPVVVLSDSTPTFQYSQTLHPYESLVLLNHGPALLEVYVLSYQDLGCAQSYKNIVDSRAKKNSKQIFEEVILQDLPMAIIHVEKGSLLYLRPGSFYSIVAKGAPILFSLWKLIPFCADVPLRLFNYVHAILPRFRLFQFTMNLINTNLDPQICQKLSLEIKERLEEEERSYSSLLKHRFPEVQVRNFTGPDPRCCKCQKELNYLYLKDDTETKEERLKCLCCGSEQNMGRDKNYRVLSALHPLTIKR